MLTIALRGNDIEKARRALSMLGDQVRPAIVRSLNRSVQGMATDAGQLSRQTYNVRSGDVKRSMTLVKANPATLWGAAISKGNVLSLRDFSPSPAPGKRRPSVGLSVVIKRQTGRARIAGSFWGQMPDRDVASVFRRVGKARLPIVKLFGPSVPQMLGNKDVLERIQAKAADRFSVNLDHEVNRVFASLGTA